MIEEGKRERDRDRREGHRDRDRDRREEDVYMSGALR